MFLCMCLCVGEWKWQRHPYTQWRNELNIKTPTNNSIKLKSHQFPIVFSVCHLFQQTHRAYPLFIFRRLIAVYNAIFAVERHTHTQKHWTTKTPNQKKKSQHNNGNSINANFSFDFYCMNFRAFTIFPFPHPMNQWPARATATHKLTTCDYFPCSLFQILYQLKSVSDSISALNKDAKYQRLGVLGWRCWLLCIRQYFVVFSPTIAHRHHPHHYYYHHHQQHHSVESTLSLSVHCVNVRSLCGERCETQASRQPVTQIYLTFC